MKNLSTGTKLELLGMSLVLLSAAWTLYLSDALAFVLQDGYFYRVEQKLDAIWNVLADYYSQSEANRSDASFITDFKVQLDKWNETLERRPNIISQYNFFSAVGGIGFLIGSVCIIGGKYLEANDK